MRLKHIVSSTLLLLSLGLGALPASADQEPGWSLQLDAVAAQPTGGGGFDPAFGGGLAVKYRASRRVGFGISAATLELESRVDFEFTDDASFTTVAAFDATPLLAELDWHLTPDKGVDVYVGPVVGWTRYGDIKVSFEGDIAFIDIFPVPPIKTKDAFVWGAHAGIDVPLGSAGWFFSGDLTFLGADLERGGEVVIADGEEESFRLNPVLVHFGIGFRF